MRATRDYTDEQGLVTPALLVVAVVLVAVTAFLFRLGSAADLAAGAQNAADAAALAGAGATGADLEAGLLESSEGLVDPDSSAGRAAATDFAARNGARLVEYEQVGLRVFVTVEASTPASGWLGLSSPPTARAAAEVTPIYSAGLPKTSSRTLTARDLSALEERAGARVIPGSALLTYGSSCDTGVDVVHLSDAMKVALIRLERSMGRPVRLTSAYRDISCQARLFATVPGPVAAPGRSMHNHGLAVDVVEPGAVAPHARAAGLCQPLPATDAVHFALAASKECAGRAGTLTAGSAFGGDPSRFVAYEVHLVEEEAR